MPFILKKGSNYFWPVKYQSPSDTGGKWDTQTFDAQFKRLSDSRVKELLNDEKNTDLSFCVEILVGWRGVMDESKVEIPFSESARDELLDQPSLAKAIASAYLESIVGAKVKN